MSATAICVGSSRLIYIRAGSGRLYWADALTSTINALNFATAESSPDHLLDCKFMGDTLLLFGAETVEFWPASKLDPALPFVPLVGRVFPVGIRATGCATLFASTFAWITNRNQVCVGNPDTVISNSGLEERLRASTTASLFKMRIEGDDFLVVRLDTSTWVFSTRSSQWSTFESYSLTNWIPQCSTGTYLGSGVDGNVIQFSNDHQDFGGVLERRFRAGAPLNGDNLQVNNVMLRTNPGQTPFIVPTYDNPTVEMRASGDGGFTWSKWREKSLGKQGVYRMDMRWRSLGLFGSPGFLAAFRVTDPVPFRVSEVLINEGYPGP